MFQEVSRTLIYDGWLLEFSELILLITAGINEFWIGWSRKFFD